jgi:predicted NBD/HSP70 family sugar kinase
MLGVNIPALPASLRRTNQRTVISLLLRLGCASRADLAKAAGISQPTAGKITTELLQLGILQRAGSSLHMEMSGAEGPSPRLGRPGQLLRLDDQFPRFLAIELGVSETSVSALPVAVKLEDDWAFTFPTPKTPEAWQRELSQLSKKIPRQHLWAILVSAPGIVDEDRARVLFSPNLHWLETVSLPELLNEIWDVPVALVQEIRALALGHLTAEPGGEDFFLVDFGQGVGGAIVIDGQLFSQPMPISGEFGHTPVPGNDRPCGCGAVGCLETMVSYRGLLQSFAAAQGLTSAQWKQLANHVSDQGIPPWLLHTLDATAQVIAGAINVLGIHRVVVTGLLADLPPAVVKHLAAEIQRGAMWARFGEIRCQSAPHRRAAGLVAAGIDRIVLPADDDTGALAVTPRSRRPKSKNAVLGRT